jgi:hypothetical protein
MYTCMYGAPAPARESRQPPRERIDVWMGLIHTYMKRVDGVKLYIIHMRWG